MFFFQAEDGIRDLVRSRGLGDVYKRQGQMISVIRLLRAALLESALRLERRSGLDAATHRRLSLIHI